MGLDIGFYRKAAKARGYAKWIRSGWKLGFDFLNFYTGLNRKNAVIHGIAKMFRNQLQTLNQILLNKLSPLFPEFHIREQC